MGILEVVLIPAHIDKEKGYRYYETSQLIDLSKIISLSQIGMSIKDIKKVREGYDLKELLEIRKKKLKIILNFWLLGVLNKERKVFII